MFIRLVRFTLTEGNQSKAEAMANDLVTKIKQQPGCQAAYFYGGAADGVSGLCVLWDSQEHATAAAGVIRPQLDAYLSGNVAGPPDAGLFPVLAS